MKKITLQAAFAILENCSAVIWDDNFLCYFSCSDLTGESDNQFGYISGVDGEGQEYSAQFQEGENQEVKIVGSSMFLIDDEGEEVQLSILEPAKLTE